MDEEQAQELVEALEELGIDDVEVLADYSGRGMYGRHVVALTAHTDIRGAIGYAAGRFTNLDFEALPNRLDSLGLGVVIY